MQFMGFRRGNGRVGVRNHVVILSTVFCSSTVARKIANATGAVAITHENGCLELGPHRAHTERVLRGVLEGCEQIPVQELVDSAAGKPVQGVLIRDEGGTSAAVEAGSEIARELLQYAKDAEREPVDVSELTLATQCGSSDTGSGLASNPAVGVVADKLVEMGGTVLLGETGSLYGAAGVMSKRAVSPEIAQRIIEITDVMERYYSRMGKSLKEANPTPGNIAGGLTTLVEKSLGGVRKGGTTPIHGVLKPGERVPADGKGLWIMDTSLGLGTHTTTDMIAGGAQIMIYTTGGGNPVGSPIAPVLKVTATPETMATLGENMDFDASPVLLGTETLQSCGQRLFEEFVAVAEGKLTKAEQLNNNLFAIGTVAVL